MGDIYSGTSYPMDSPREEYGLNLGYNTSAAAFAVPSDPRSSNQLKAVSDKINTGAKTIEFSGVMQDKLESIPNHHLKEVARLRKLAGIDLTFHGPLIEATGISKQGWDESQRVAAERQMFSAVQRAHELDKEGNIVVTFHSSNGLPAPETVVRDPKTGKETVMEIMVIDEREGRFGQVRREENKLTGESDPIKKLDQQNEQTWLAQLQRLNFTAQQGSREVERALGEEFDSEDKDKKSKFEKNEILNYYKMSLTNPDEYKNRVSALGEDSEIVKHKMREVGYGDIQLRDAYQELQDLYSKAYYAAEKAAKGKKEGAEKAKEDIKKLDKFKEDITPKLSYLKDPEKLNELSEEVVKGINVLRSIQAPRILTPLKDFAIDKAAETFSNLAYNSYKEFKDHSPIISIENPPAGSGLATAEELKAVIQASRDKFIQKAVEEKKMDKNEAKKQAEKLIGATWDVGHINMLRKHGYEEKQLEKQTETIAPFVKHIHLSDNFGMEHTELPMGMGNVPLKAHMEKLREGAKGQFDKIKQVVETGNWFEPFKSTPLRETLSAFNSPIYGMKMNQNWNQSAQLSTGSGYFSGYGQVLPDVNFSMYGAGFSSLPQELGGQVGGGRNRFSGAPME